MKLIEAIKWEASKKAICIIYADASSDLAGTIGDLEISSGSLAYTANGSVYVFDGTDWAKIGA